jgi:general secretion pathway protein C
MSSRWTGFLVWALVAASTAFWGLKIFAATRPLPAGVQTPGDATPRSGPMEHLFGAVVVPTVAAAAPPPESTRYQLVGVIAPRAGADARSGVAIVSIDQQPAKPWHVGATLDGNTTLLSVAKRSADFGPPGGPTAFSLALPEPAAAETGTLPGATSQPVPQAAQPQGRGQVQAATAPRFEAALPDPGVQGSPGRENAQHVAQPGIPGVPRFGRMGMGRPDVPRAQPPVPAVQQEQPPQTDGGDGDKQQ